MTGLTALHHRRYTAVETAYANGFGKQTRLNLTALSSPVGITFSRGCYEHHTSEHAGFWTGASSDSSSTTQSTLLGLLLNAAGSRSAQVAVAELVQQNWIDECMSMGCGACSPGR